MRRYGVRILVAVLTFLLGVAFSFGLGLFRVKETHHKERWRSKRDCPKRFVTTAHPVTIYNHEGAPVQLTFLGPTSDTAFQRERMLQILVENKSDKAIAGYFLAGDSFRKQRSFAFGDYKVNLFLKPGQSEMSLLPSNEVSRTELWLSQVQFNDGSIWSNPRTLR